MFWILKVIAGNFNKLELSLSAMINYAIIPGKAARLLNKALGINLVRHPKTVNEKKLK